MRRLALTAVLAFALSGAGFAASPASAETALFAGGCFWCLESDMDHVTGVSETISGYAGGTTENPTYDDYSSGGHREVVKVTFDPGVVSYGKLVDIFLHSVDVTDGGGQFCDRGHAYTTAIYALDDQQKKTAETVRAADEKELGSKIVTPVEGPVKFWAAEDYHQNYYKSQKRTLTRFGYVTRADAYKGYRKGCGRDARVRDVWGASAYKGIAGHEGS
ncbi:peptide-methionine (S)-S-oxide reductase [Breoghania corrubedonensis]|uniref:Peptide methionine sulfoxide reductase MsrA n=1 Tax=Breoghania corrubedonensis TaxID=665038 RepID=A0A2T5VGW3_9HYPH|nr:peptide-methionine (S)-S-oxide reductase MsrA [Breoghania corrubedonensis]PTW62966.1 peptide-methionine (S)-S-oxide reductase [Breoghania corrubedonensis]